MKISLENNFSDKEVGTETEKIDKRRKHMGMSLGNTCHYISIEERLMQKSLLKPTPYQLELAEKLGLSPETYDKMNRQQIQTFLTNMIQDSFREKLNQKKIYVRQEVIDEYGNRGKVYSINYISRILRIEYIVEGKKKYRRIAYQDIDKLSLVK